MSRKDTVPLAAHRKFREEIDRIIEEGKVNRVNINILQATRLAAEKSKRGKMTWEEAFKLLDREGLL